MAFACARATAQEQLPAPATPGSAFGARARIPAQVAATNAEDSTASGTTIEVGDRSAALENVAEVLGEAPGARVQNTGGFGSFSGVSLRGAGAEHTSVLFGELPLNTTDTGPFDFSSVPLAALDAVEIYRGGAPAIFNDGAIGGVVRLVPRSAEHSYLRAETGYGSFGRFELSTTSSIAHQAGANPALFARVSLARADNDYPYVDDNQTRFDTVHAKASADDVTLHQRNADIHVGDAIAHAAVDALSGRFDVVLTGQGRAEGVPGPLAAPSYTARRQLVRMLGAASYTKEALDADGERRYRLQLLASANRQDNRVTDLGAELGPSHPSAARDVWSRGFAKVAASAGVAEFLEPTLIASVSRDDYRPADPLAFSYPPRPSGRTSEALGAEARLHGALDATRVELRPSIRGQWSQTSIWSNTLGTESAPQLHDDRAEFVATYRIAASVAPWRALALSSSVFTGARLPALLELFGDRVYQEPNSGLKPERSRGLDLSVVARASHAALHGSAELRGFALAANDLIGYQRTAQYTVRAENIANARVLGLELGIQGGLGRHFALTGALTALTTRNQLDQRLPLRPPLQFTLRPELYVFPSFADRLQFFAEAEHVAYVYLDDANRTLLPGRTIFSLGGALDLWNRHLTLSARARNLFDVRATDVLSRPLPGFQLLFSLAITESIG